MKFYKRIKNLPVWREVVDQVESAAFITQSTHWQHTGPGTITEEITETLV